MKRKKGSGLCKTYRLLMNAFLIAVLLFSATCSLAEDNQKTTDSGDGQGDYIVFCEPELSYDAFSAEVSGNSGLKADISACSVQQETLVAILRDYADMEIRFTLEPYGVVLTNTQELLVLDGIRITDLEPLKQVIPYLKNLKQIDMCECGIDDETMDALNKSFEAVKIVWTVDLKHWKLRTDATHFATWDYKVDKDGYIYTAKNVTSNTSKSLDPLRYCTDLIALDLGHNKIKDISFLSGLKNLKYLIIALNEIEDISPLENLTELKYLEIFNNDISDITPISKLPKLEAVYMTAIPVKDISCLYGNKTLRLLYLEGYRFNNEKRKEIQQALPECEILYRKQSTTSSRAWRVHPYYKEMRRALGWKVED